MKYLTIELIKKQCNIDSWYHDDDEYLAILAETAESMVDEHLNNNLSKILEENNNRLPAPIRQAMLLLVGNFYQNREGIAFTAVTELPLSYSYLLYPYKSYKKSES